MPRRRRGGDRDYEEGYNDGYEAGFRAGVEYGSGEIELPRRAERTIGRRGTVKRRKTKYQAAYSAAYKRLKRSTPYKFWHLSKKAHAAARKKVK